VPPQANVPAAKAFNAAVAKYEHVTAPLTAIGVVGWFTGPGPGSCGGNLHRANAKDPTSLCSAV
jgi:hypothetical protein